MINTGKHLSRRTMLRGLGVSIALPKGESSMVSASPTAAKGLVVHRHIDWPDFDATGETWTLTHVGSGMAVGQYYRSRKVAIETATTLATLADWTRPQREIVRHFKQHPRLRVRLKAALKAGGAPTSLLETTAHNKGVASAK